MRKRSKIHGMTDKEICEKTEGALTASHAAKMLGCSPNTKVNARIKQAYANEEKAFAEYDAWRRGELLADARAQRLTIEEHLKETIVAALCKRYRSAVFVYIAFGVCPASKDGQRVAAMIAEVVKEHNIYMLRGAQVPRSDDQIKKALEMTESIYGAAERLGYTSVTKAVFRRFAQVAWDNNMTFVCQIHGIKVRPIKQARKDNRTGACVTYENAKPAEKELVRRRVLEGWTEYRIANSLDIKVSGVAAIKRGLRKDGLLDFVHASRSTEVDKPKKTWEL